MKIVGYHNKQDAAHALAATVSAQLHIAITDKNQASIAVAGGSTPDLFFSALSQAQINWSKVNVTTTDERQVALDHERSNARLLKQTLLTANAGKANFYPMTKAASADNLALDFESHFNPLDVCVLGMGEDGHTASLFPGVDVSLLDPENLSLVAFVDAPGDLEPRITLTTHALLSASHIHILIHGEVKRQVLDQAMSGKDAAAMPVRSILQNANGRVVVHHARD